MTDGRIVTACIMVMIFAAMVAVAFSYGADARFLPLLVGIPGLILSVVQLIIEVCAPCPSTRHNEYRNAFIMFSWFIAFVVAIVLFGFIIAGPILASLYLSIYARERWYVSLGSGALAWLALYGGFDRLLRLPLFGGLITHLLYAHVRG